VRGKNFEPRPEASNCREQDGKLLFLGKLLTLLNLRERQKKICLCLPKPRGIRPGDSKGYTGSAGSTGNNSELRLPTGRGESLTVPVFFLKREPFLECRPFSKTAAFQSLLEGVLFAVFFSDGLARVSGAGAFDPVRKTQELDLAWSRPQSAFSNAALQKRPA